MSFSRRYVYMALTAAALLSLPAPDASAGLLSTDRPVTLEECVGVALGEHPRIKGAEEDVKAADFRTEQAASTFWPQVSAGASRSWSHAETSARTANANINNLDLNLSWDVFDFGRTYYTVKSSSALASATVRDLNAAQQTVAYDVMDSYYNLLKAQSLVKVAQESLNNANDHLKQAQAFFEVGVKPRYDVTKAEVEVNNAKVRLISAEDAVKGARVNLNTRLAIDPLTPLIVQDRPQLEVLDKPMEGYFEDALRNRPELLGLQERLRANELAVKSTRAEYLPQINATGNVGILKEDSVPGTFDSNTFAIAVDLPVFEGFRTRARVGEARANTLSTRYRVEDTKTGVLNQVSSAYIAIEDARARTDALNVSVRSARENLDIAQGRYEAGVGALIDVTDAQVSLTQAETDLAQAFYDYHLAHTSLLRSTGKAPLNK
jgi:outer membrane protein